tara:strand:+ start:863 stop:2362 length:1500 start_codon:yes stop_codon:yes gene_type:complete
LKKNKMQKELIHKFSQFQKQSKFGSIVFFFESVRKNIYNFIYVFLPALQGYFLLSLAIFVLVLLGIGIFSFINYYYFAYKFDFNKSAFIIQKGFFTKTKLSIPFEKIQQINFNQNLIHKIFNLYEVQMDTAGSDNTEVDIKAVSKKIADDLKVISAKIKRKNILKTTVEENTSNSLNINILRLIKIGLTSRYFETFGLILGTIALGFQFLEDLDIDYTKNIEQVISTTNFGLIFTLVALLIIIIAILVINLVSTILKYFNFTAIKSSNNLEISYGLVQTKSIILSPRKVQQFQIIQNYLQKTLDILEIKINQASSTKIVKDNNRSKIIIPGFTKNEKNDLFKYIFNQNINEQHQMKPHIRKLMFSLIFTSILPALIFLLIFLFFEIISLKYVLLTSLSYLILTSFVNWRYYKNNSLTIAKDFIVYKSGFWDIKSTIIETFKIQSIILSQPVWHKKRNLGDIIFYTAGGYIKAKIYDFSDLKDIVNSSIYSVEISNKKWM